MQITEISGMTQSMPPIVDNPVSVFESPVFGSARVVADANGNPWFVAKDVAEALEYSSASLKQLNNLFGHVPEEWKGINRIMTLGGEQLLLCLSEQGLYFFLGRSDKPKSFPFQKWLADDVLPTIRKHGFYGTPQTIEAMIEDPDTAIRLLLTVKEERQKRLALEAQAAIDRPKVIFADSIEVSKTSILVGELAKLIKQSTGVDVGQNRMFEFLRENGYIHKYGSQKNMPTQRSVGAGWMEIKEGTRIGSSGESHITKTTKITGKGQIYFVNLFKKMAAN